MTDDMESPETPSRLDRTALRARKPDRATFHDRPRTPLALVLDGVDGNYNKGALFRLADAFMLEKLHFCGTTLEHWHRRFTKSARGTFPWVPHAADEATLDVIAEYRARGYQIVVTEQCTRSVTPWDADLRTPVCLVLGGELSGVDPAVVAAADTVVELPTLGMANSMNVAMSAGMMVFAIYQRMVEEQR